MPTESQVEAAVMAWFRELDYATAFGPTIAPGEALSERAAYGDVILLGRLRQSIVRINPKIPTAAHEDAIAKLGRTESQNLYENNRRFHKLLTEGVPVEYQKDGRAVHDVVWLVDFDKPENNDWLAVNQFTVVEDHHNRRADVVVFINGLPLGILELKSPSDQNATVKNAFNQFQTYKKQIPTLFIANEMLVASDGIEAKCGTLTSDWEWFMPWRTIDGSTVADNGVAGLEVLIKGVFDKKRVLDFLRYFIVFDAESTTVIKKMAAYHQYHAVNKAIECTAKASASKGDKRVGVVWHTQGSGKSLTMVFYAGKLIQHPPMANPTLVVLTDRNDLDDQLFGTFSSCANLLRQKPQQADNRAALRELLKVASGGVVFTTIQKFMPEQRGDKFPMLSDRRNIVVIADEAHRSQYDFIDGFARHMRDALPNASFIGFTGTPIERDDKNTQAVFGDYIDVYDILRAVEDKATVPIYYECRLAKLALKKNEQPKVDAEFEEVTEAEEQVVKEKLKSRWARLEAMVGNERRVDLIAKDLVEHFELRQGALEGKGMIVCMSRRICIELYRAICKLRPQWHSDDDDKGFLKVIMTGSATDAVEWQPHIRSKSRREEMAKRFKNPAHPFSLVIVRDMWLTGFDAPCLHTLYVDKPMQGHGLMQTIARVNRVFKNKPAGLVVDYLGIADQLKRALAVYTDSGGRGEATLDQEQAVAVLLEKHEILLDLFHGFDLDAVRKAKAAKQLGLIKAAMDYVLGLEDGKQRYLQTVTELSKAFAISVPNEKALEIRDDVALFQTIRAQIIKHTVSEAKSVEELDSAIRQIISKAIVSEGIVDIYGAAGLKKPDISVLDDKFLEELRGMPHKNLALETLRKLLNDEIKLRSQKNLVQSKAFSEMLETAIRRYQNRAIETAQVIDELIRLAKDMRQAHKRGVELGLSDDEVAFYDALETNDSAVKVLGDKNLKIIARELVETVKKNTSIDWTEKESVRAKLRSVVRRILRKYGYPPDKQEKATETVLEQAALLSKDWVAV